MKGIQFLSETLQKYHFNNINVNVEERWLKGIKHHEKSIELFTNISELDFVHNKDCLGLKSGGDGDNGEYLMYLFDMYFELQDKLNTGVKDE